MDTPEKTQITTPLSKFEDSPLFNYINSLSPIKPVKSINITQTFHSLSFTSLPSVFTSPHVISHNESRFLRRHKYSDPSKPESSSENGNKVSSDEGGVDQLYDNSAEQQENFDPGVSIAEASAEHVKFAIKQPQRLQYDCGSPECDTTTHCGSQIGCMPELVGISALEVSQKCPTGGEMHEQEIHQAEHKKEATDGDWEILISDTSNLLIFNSPMDNDASFPTLGEAHRMRIESAGYGEIEMEYPTTQPGETIELKEINRSQDNLAANNNPNDEVDNEVGMLIGVASKVVSNLHRGLRRRCLDFEMVGAHRKNLADGSKSSTSLSGKSDKNISSEDKQQVSVKPGSDSSRCVLPGIGLHLNALAITSKESKNLKHETLSSQISLRSSITYFHSPATSQELTESMALVPAERDMDPTEASASLVTEEFNHSSPKKKRRKLDGENEACKRCHCKKSKCLKLYCECFAAGVYCIEPCSCQDCFNKPIHEDTVLATRKQIESRNPLAFAPKVIRSSDPATEMGDESSKTPASARHKRGCNCKKSGCLKKYCECYQGGAGCSINCRCEGCKNAFGRKDGSAFTETEAEPEDEIEGDEKNGADQISQATEIQNSEDQNPNSALPMTPLSLCRPLLPSKSKPPRSFLGIGSYSGLFTGQKYGKPNILRPRSRPEKQLPTIPDSDMPEILSGIHTPSTKTSPNSKRVSPPHSILGSSPGQRSGRKLILQSIPSFPSLTPQH